MLPILYQDDELLAVNKPSGLLSVPGRGPDKQDCVIARLSQGHPEIRCIHRLDRDTSGVLLLAKTASAQRNLSHQFEIRQVNKRYEAIVFGHLAEQQGEIDLPIAKDFSAPPRHRIDHENGRRAQTSYSVLSRETMPLSPQHPASELMKVSRVTLSPLTGRSHQLRIHLTALGHPIVGDPLYSPPDVQEAAARLMLHACELTFTHPESGEQITLNAICPF